MSGGARGLALVASVALACGGAPRPDPGEPAPQVADPSPASAEGAPSDPPRGGDDGPRPPVGPLLVDEIRVPPGAPPPVPLQCRDEHTPTGCFVRVPPGVYTLGAQRTDPAAPGYDPRAAADDTPPRTVTVGELWVHGLEVSAREVMACVDAGACRAEDWLREGALASVGHADRLARAAVGPTRAGAEAYCAFIGGRLPTADEWEAAARGLTSKRFPWGDEPACAPDYTEVGEEDKRDRVAAACADVLRPVKEAQGDQVFPNWSRRVFEALDAERMIAACGELAGASAPAVVARLDALADDALRVAGRVFDDDATAPSCQQVTPPDPWFMKGWLPRGMAGGLWEWTSEQIGADGVVRGGAYTSTSAWEFRAAARLLTAPDRSLPDVGLRCVVAR